MEGVLQPQTGVCGGGTPTTDRRGVEGVLQPQTGGVWRGYSNHRQGVSVKCTSLRMGERMDYTINIRYGKVVTSSKVQDLVGVPEGCPHHNCLVAKLLVVVVN